MAEAALSFAAWAMIGNGQTVLHFAAGRDGGLQSFKASVLGTSRQMLLPQYYGLFFQRALQPEDGYIFRSIGRSGCTDPESRCTRFVSCGSSDNAKKYARRVHAPRPPTISHNGTNVRHIVSDPTKADMEIKRMCRNVKELWQAKARKVFCRDLATNGHAVDSTKLAQVRGAVDATNAAVQSALFEGGAIKELELWRTHKEHLNRVSEKGNVTKGQSAPDAPQLVHRLLRPDLRQRVRGNLPRDEAAFNFIYIYRTSI